MKCMAAADKTRKSWRGSHYMYKRTMPGPAIEIDDLRSTCSVCEARKKDNPQWFLPVFQATLLTKITEHFGVHIKRQTSTVKDNRRTGGVGAHAADTVDPLVAVTPARPRV